MVSVDHAAISSTRRSGTPEFPVYSQDFPSPTVAIGTMTEPPIPSPPSSFKHALDLIMASDSPLTADELQEARARFESDLADDHERRLEKVARRKRRAGGAATAREQEARNLALNALRAEVQADFYKKNGYKLYTDSTGREHWLTPEEYEHRMDRAAAPPSGDSTGGRRPWWQHPVHGRHGAPGRSAGLRSPLSHGGQHGGPGNHDPIGVGRVCECGRRRARAVATGAQSRRGSVYRRPG